jgi:hypothetical protein
MSIETRNQQLMNRNFDSQCQIFQQSKQLLNNTAEKVNNTIKQSTVIERDNVEKAIKILNNKVSQLMKSDNIRKQLDTINKCEKEITVTFSMAMKLLNEGRHQILNNQSLDQKTKQVYLQKLQQKISEKMYTKSEIERFNKMLTQLVILK